MKDFKSEYFDTIDDLLAAKSSMESDMSQRRRRLRIIRQFSNGLATMSEAEAKTLGVTEIVNHLTTYKFLSQRKKRLEQSFTTTRTFVEIRIDTDNPEFDRMTGLRMTTAFNRGCLYDGGEFRGFIKALAGESQIAGGSPVVHQDKGGWAPRLATNMLFPKGCGLTAADVPYAMAPKSYTLADLEGLAKSIKGEDGVHTSKKAVEALIRILKKRPKGQATESGGFALDASQKEKVGSVVEDNTATRNATIDAWWYYEVKTNRETGLQHVSGTFFTQEVNMGSELADKTGPMVIAFFERLFETPGDWLHLVCMDMEIGGDVTLDSVRGVAEIMYPSASEIEVLLNLMIQGDKSRAKPKWQVESGAVADEVLAWDPDNDSVAPTGVVSMDMKGSSAPLLTPIQMLTGNAAGLAGGDVSNSPRGGELRQQALERQGNNTTMQFGDMADWTCQLEDIALTMVERTMVGEVRAGARGYHQIMWVRACLKKYNIPVDKLFKKEHGRLKYVTVRVRRVMGEGGIDSEKRASDFLMSLYSKIAPQNRPKVLQSAIAVETQDPDLAEDLVTIPLPVINSQKHIAESEYAVICYMAALGMPMTTSVDDVDMDHLPIHMLQMVSKISKHQKRPWDGFDVIEFTGLQRHAQDHLENMLGDKDTMQEGQQFIPQFQEIMQTAQALVAQVEEQEGQAQQQNGGMTEKERAEIELKAAAEHRKGVELGLKVEGNLSLEKQRIARQTQVSRQGYVRELSEAARLDIERKRLALEAEKMRREAAAPAAAPS